MDETNPAKLLAKKRWEGTTKEERTAAGRHAANGRMAKLTPERRSEIARAAVAARVKKLGQTPGGKRKTAKKSKKKPKAA